MNINKTSLQKWVSKRLGDICTFAAGGTPSTKEPSYWTNGTIKWISAKCIEGDKVIGWDYITEKALKNSNSKLAHKGDLILVTRVSVGKLLFCQEELAVNQDLTIINTGKENPKYIFYLLKEKTPVILNRRQGLSIKGITKDELKNIIVHLPGNCNEQQKIVEVLETWDKAIQLTRKLIEQKELQKKGLLQQLVYKQPKTVSYFLRQLFTLGRGRVISKEEIAQHPGAYPVYSSQTADNGVLGFINTFDFDGEYITWTTDGANAGKVFYRTGKFNCTNVCGTAQLKQKNQHNLYYIMSYLNNVTKKYVSYVGNPKLMNGVFANILIALPSKELQDKATALLTTLDKEIDLLRQKLAKLEEQKKGLMQVLLTGKVRIPLRGGIHG